VMKRISILSFLFLAYGALLAHNFAPHTHHDEVEHRSDSYHDYENGDKGVLNALLAKVVHFPGSADFYSSHNTNSFFKFSIQQFHIPENRIFNFTTDYFGIKASIVFPGRKNTLLFSYSRIPSGTTGSLI
jgi:hypothetical protein